MIGGGGEKQPSVVLNKTLKHIVLLLEKYNISDWFLGYGTLLGIVRNNSCIKHDDDIDIIINRMKKNDLHQLAKENKFKVTLQKGNYFLRFEHPDYAPIDFYLAKVEDTTFIDTWENTRWTDVYPLVKKKWKGVTLQLPRHYLKNLKNRYGSTWRTPKKTKGVHSRTMKKPLFI
jgi:phosphorylcholine metabolism protein LicD